MSITCISTSICIIYMACWTPAGKCLSFQNGFIQSKVSSYKKTQECLDVVAKEFKFQGHTMAGPCASAQLAGKRGLRPGNVARDLKRKFDRMLQDDVFGLKIL